MASDVAQLYAERPKNRFLRTSVIVVLALAALSWAFGDLGWSELATARRWHNVARFVNELTPYPLRDGIPETTVLGWLRDVVFANGARAALTTLLISIVAICLAGAGSLLLSSLAARNISASRPFGVSGAQCGSTFRTGSLSLMGSAARTVFLLARAIPEYVYAFLLLAIYGPTTWPLILALAIHNLGILGRLTAEAIEDAPPRRSAVLRASGFSRAQILLSSVFPGILGRFFVYFFYRWETCVRDATVLGMLGVASLGYLISDARARSRYDELAAYVLVGVLLVLLGDIISWSVRRLLRSDGSS